MVYNNEIKKAISWLINTQNKENFGWSWVRDISPNAQNTAEVVYCVSLFADKLSDNERQLINEAVIYWLLNPQRYASINIDWIWIGLALNEYLQNYQLFAPEVEKGFVENALALCVDNMLTTQNDDGGWADYKGDMSTTVRTALALYFLCKQSYSTDNEINVSARRAADWLRDRQNADGGFGNIKFSERAKDLSENFEELDFETIKSQCDSTMSATGYALMAISAFDKFMYYREIDRAVNYLKRRIQSGNRFELFSEIGIRKNTIFTFRHFGEIWAGLGLFESKSVKFSTPEMLSILKYIISLEDNLHGGYRCSESSDVYTWSNCNVLMFLHAAIDNINSISAMDMTELLTSYMQDKEQPEVVSNKVSSAAMVIIALIAIGSTVLHFLR